MTAPIQEPKRIRQLREWLVKAIPTFPNDRATVASLESKPLPVLLLAYANWASRLVPPRPRRIKIEPTLTADRRYKSVRDAVRALLGRVKRGDELTPHLSLDAIQSGYTPWGGERNVSDRWADKDFTLITMGYHHFHLGEMTPKGHADRTKLVLFAQLTRDSFSAIALFDHTVFHGDVSPMPPERERLWRIFDYRNSIGRPPGVYLAANPIASSGHSDHHIGLANHYSRTIWTIDPKLDDLGSRSEVFSQVSHADVKAMKLQWELNYLDLLLKDRTTGQFYEVQRGPI